MRDLEIYKQWWIQDFSLEGGGEDPSLINKYSKTHFIHTHLIHQFHLICWGKCENFETITIDTYVSLIDQPFN